MISQRRTGSRTSLLQRRARTKGASSLRARLGIRNHVRSHSALSQLFSSHQGSDTGDRDSVLAPANTPAVDDTPSSQPEPASVRSHTSMYLDLQDNEKTDNMWTPRQRSRSQASPLPLNTFAAHWAATVGSYDLGRRQRSRISNSDDSVQTDPNDSSDRLFAPLSLPRAYTLDELDTNASLRGRQGWSRQTMGEAPFPLPRIMTMSSVTEKDGGDMETGIDDLPPMRLGREITNDLRRIELTFSNQPEEPQARRANPLKHLIKSRHNFRALVTYGGYLIPINVLLNVILLGRGWLQYNNPRADGESQTVNNPTGYLITSVISLVLIVSSGICFVMRCLEFDVMRTTMTSIIANFTNAALILASALIYEKRERPRHPDAHITGEFYSSYAGAAVALLNALFLLMDMLITPGFRYRGSGMSRQQRMLQFNIILIVVWIGIGGYAWSKIEGWDTPTAIMFCMVTVTTIGFGNKSPTKTYSRVLQLVYGPLGILMFGMMLLHTRNVIIQITRDKIDEAKREILGKRKKLEQDVTISHVKRRLAARPQARNWHDMFNDLAGRVLLPHRRRVRIGIPHWLRRRLDGSSSEDEADRDLELGIDHRLSDARGTDRTLSARDLDMQRTTSTAANKRASRVYRRKNKLPGDDPNAAPLPLGRSYTTASRLSQVREAISVPGFFERIRHRRKLKKAKGGGGGDGGGDPVDLIDDKPGSSSSGGGNSRRRRRRQEKESSDDGGDGTGDSEDSQEDEEKDTSLTGKQKQKKSKQKKKKFLSKLTRQLWAALILNFCFWLISAAIFYACESPHWSYFDAMYFCYVAFTTIGYGDIVPETTQGTIVFICLCFVAVALETFLVVSAIGFFSDLLARAMKQTQVQRRIEKRRRRLVAYEIRRHIKHPNYNPFGDGSEDRAVDIGFRRLRKFASSVRAMATGKMSFGQWISSQRNKRDPVKDDALTDGFIRHATGMDGFGPSEWQPPSPPASPVTDNGHTTSDDVQGMVQRAAEPMSTTSSSLGSHVQMPIPPLSRTIIVGEHEMQQVARPMSTGQIPVVCNIDEPLLPLDHMGRDMSVASDGLHIFPHNFDDTRPSRPSNLQQEISMHGAGSSPSIISTPREASPGSPTDAPSGS
ncbi:Potassium channel [Linderina pennispora]|nr:Potassium channel [Linderina pennispora]